MKYKLICLLTGAAALLAASCTDAPPEDTAHISGQLTVADSLDASGDYSGIGVSVINRDTGSGGRDTLFHSVTDREGRFEGTIRIPSQDTYPLVFSRNGEQVGETTLYLSADDSVSVSGDLADLQQTLEISSREHSALELLERLDRTFSRVSLYARAGRISADSLTGEMEKWGDLYWDVYSRYPETIAGKQAATETIRLLSVQDPAEMMRKLREIREDEELVNLAAIHGKERAARQHGLDYALAYLDTLQRLNPDEESLQGIRMERIKLLYDSARVENAMNLLAEFQEDYADDSAAMSWSESIRYDLEYLAPGDTIPDFSFGANGGTVSRESLMGSPYILEITNLANSLYQQQFDRAVVIHSIYKNYGLDIVTIPLDGSQVTVEAFFEERVRPWPVAGAGEFDAEELRDRFNIRSLPTRFLVDSEGRIVRKYVRTEFRDIIQGIQNVIANEEPPS